MKARVMRQSSRSPRRTRSWRHLEALETRIMLDYAPDTLVGRGISLSVTGGTGNYSTSGEELFVASVVSGSHDFYVLSMSASDGDAFGTYTYAKTSATTGTIRATERSSGTVNTVNFNFSSATGGTYTITSVDGTQGGTFVVDLEPTGTAPATFAASPVTFEVTAGRNNMASSGYYTVSTNGSNYTTVGGGGIDNSSGTFTYSVTTQATAVVNGNDASNGPFVVQMVFETGTSGKFLIADPASDSWQIGHFDAQAQPTTTPPTGSVDQANLSHVSGWAFDADAGSGSIQVRVDIDGAAGTPFTANLARPDLQSALGSTSHGYNFTLPTLSNGVHTIKVYAIDTPTGNAVQIGSTQTVTNHAPIGAVGAATLSGLAGWAFDADAGSTPIQVRVDIDGTPGTPFTANVTRTDLQSYLGSTNHGFSYTMPTLTAGAHTIKVYALGAPDATPVLLSTQTVQDHAPIGSVDAATLSSVSGWAFDAEAGSSAVQVRVDVDGTPGTPFAANLARADLQSYLGSANHGYTYTLPALAAGVHTIKVFALNTPGGDAVQIGTTRSVTNHAPIGAVGVANSQVLVGWAFDADAGSTPIQIRVDIDNSTGTPYTASLTRSDLQNYLGSTNHGFVYTMPTTSIGDHTVKVYLLDKPSGTAQLLTTKTITTAGSAPVGSFDVATLTQAIGWAYDADAGSSSIQVRVDIDGTAGTPFDASLARPDLQNYLGSANHGYRYTMPALDVGSHSVKVYAIDSPSGDAVQLGTTRTVTNHAPIGHVDIANLTQIVGWAADLDATSTAVGVRVDIDGTTVTTMDANQARPDLQSYLGSANHGWAFPLPPLSVGTHTIDVFAMDTTSGSAVQLGTTKTLVNTAPIGHFDYASATQIFGWAYDANAGASPIQVRIDIDGAQGTPFAAGSTRADLQSYLGSANHGFFYAISPALSAGSHTINVYAFDSTDGSAVLLGTKTVIV